MQIEIAEHAKDRVMAAVERRGRLLRMYTREMPADYAEQLTEMDRIIAAAVVVGVYRHNSQSSREYREMSGGH
jgi:hypothetical protein